MFGRVVAILLQVVLGLALAGLLMGVVVSQAGPSAGPVTAVGVTLVSVLFVMLVWRRFTRPRESNRARR